MLEKVQPLATFRSTVKIQMVTAEASVTVDLGSDAGIKSAVSAIMNAQVRSDLDGVDPSALSGEDYLDRNLRDLAERIARKRGVSKDPTFWSARKYGTDFKNEVFEMHPWREPPECQCGFDERELAYLRSRLDPAQPHPYGSPEHLSWCEENPHETACPSHPANDRSGLPHFRCGAFEVGWYKYIGRDMTSEPISRADLEVLFRACFASLECP